MKPMTLIAAILGAGAIAGIIAGLMIGGLRVASSRWRGPVVEMEPGKIYLGFICRKCGVDVALFEVPSRRPIQGNPGPTSLRYPSCRREADYTVSEFLFFPRLQ